jgi:GTPase
MVISGIVKSGTVRVNQQCHLGPDKNRAFKTVVVKSIHINRTVCEQALPGDLACLNIRPVKAN